MAIKTFFGVIGLVAASGATAVTPLSSWIYSNHQFKMADRALELSFGASDQWETTPRRLAISEEGTLVNPDTQGMMSGAGSVVAEWMTANAGTVDIRQSISINASHPADATQWYFWEQAFIYFFIPAQNGLLTVDYNISGTSDRDPLAPESFFWYFNIGIDGSNDLVTIFDDDNGSITATLTRPLLAGRRYEIDFGVIGYDDVFETSITPFDGEFSGNFRWSIFEDAPPPPPPPPPPAIPEPAAWALMLAGFGFVGAAVRHRRRYLIPSALRRILLDVAWRRDNPAGAGRARQE